MYSEAKKLHLIEEILKVKSDSVWIALENALKSNAIKKATKKTSIYDFVGIITEEEKHNMNEAIAEACETVEENDWK